jgi:hypothetical protein
MADLNFKFGALILGGPKQVAGGKWDATLDEFKRSRTTNADLTIFIRVRYIRVNPSPGKLTEQYPDSDKKPITIQPWAHGEFEQFSAHAIIGAQRFWDGVFWLRTPATYQDLNWPDETPTHRCNLHCRFKLQRVNNIQAAHYSIPVVRVQDGQPYFRANSLLYSQRVIRGLPMIPGVHGKTFWTHLHEVGHLLGLGHVGHGGHHAIPTDRSHSAYGVTQQEMRDVMGRGRIRHLWHAQPWQKAAESFTGVHETHWEVHMRHIAPVPLQHSAHTR